MSAASRLASGLRSLVTWQVKPLPAPEPAYGAPREAVGLFNSLSLDRQKAVLRYCGEQDHGDESFRRKVAQ